MRLSLAYRLQTALRGPLLPTNAGVLLAALVLGSLGGCLFTDPINMPPASFQDRRSRCHQPRDHALVHRRRSGGSRRGQRHRGMGGDEGLCLRHALRHGLHSL